MAKYRIVEFTRTTRDGTEIYKRYLVQKRFLGFLWWYDPFEDGLYSSGECSTYEKAMELLDSVFAVDKKKVLYEMP